MPADALVALEGQGYLLCVKIQRAFGPVLVAERHRTYRILRVVQVGRVRRMRVVPQEQGLLFQVGLAVARRVLMEQEAQQEFRRRMQWPRVRQHTELAAAAEVVGHPAAQQCRVQLEPLALAGMYCYPG